jgi:hypothetical protein
MEERRQLGLCFNCNEKFGHGHNKVCQRLFLLDLAATDDDTNAASDDPANPTLPMLLHVITDVHTYNIMQVRLRLGDVNVHALIDSGSTHNLIAEKVASRTVLPMVSCSSVSVMMASGECVPCTGMYRRVPFSINGDQFSADFFALPLSGYDVVLGT